MRHRLVKAKHGNIAGGHGAINLILLLLHRHPVMDGRVSRVAAKLRAERSQTPKADFIADIRYRHIGEGQQILCFFDAPPGQIAMRCDAISPPKCPDKVVLGKTNEPRNVVKA